MNTQNPIHTKPRAPMMTNAISHPQALASNGMLRGAIRAPIEAPALKMEVPLVQTLSFSPVLFDGIGHYSPDDKFILLCYFNQGVFRIRRY